jgi:eukaryotic-like serine/threonine-protein kinase
VSDVRTTLTSALSDRYTIERELGGGGMSRVFLAEEAALGRPVVIKVVAHELAEGLSGERFAREVKVAARLQQANIVPLLAAGVADGVPYYTMPFVRGESLRARLVRGDPIALPEAIGILRDLARALAFAHGEGVVHRDIKPENILLSGGAAVVTDFGIAKAIAAAAGGTDRPERDSERDLSPATLTQIGTSLGTPAYMAPEQAAGDPGTDHRADLYAWGLVAWEMLAGAHPFADKSTAHAMVTAQLTENPPLVSVRRPDVPVTLERLVARCLAKDPGQRPGSAAEILTELDAVTTPNQASRDRATHAASPGATQAPGRSAGVAWHRWLVIPGVAAALGSGALWYLRPSADPRPAAVSTADKSLAVLPFTALGGDTANTYFAEGIADELSTALSRLPGLRLAGRASAARVKQQGSSVQEIGNALKVGTVLDGTVRRAGDRMRVSAELTSATTGEVLWKESYEREVKDVFAVQDDIARAIVGSLQVRLAGGAAAPNASHGTSNLEAYDLYLRGLQAYRRRGPNLVQAERMLTRAIALDSNFARAHATLVSVLMVMPYYFDTSMSAVLPRARAAAERAVAIDDALPEAHVALGHVHTEAFEWKEAETEFRRAVALDPNRAESVFRLGFMLMSSGRVKESVAAFEQAKADDPLYAVSAIYLGWAYALSGRKAEAAAEARRALDLDPTNEAIGNVYANTLNEVGATEEAVAFARKMVPVTPNPRRLGFYAWVLGAGGARDDALAILRRIQVLPATTWGRNSALTYCYLAVGDTARALDALERAAAKDGDLLLAQAISSPRFDAIRSSPRFAAAMRRFGLDLSVVTAPDGGRWR